MVDSRKFSRLTDRYLAAAAAAATAMTLAFAPRLGDLLDQSVVYFPAIKLRSSLGLATAVDQRLKVVIMDDTSFRRVGGQPDQGLLLDLSHQLLAAGFQTVLIGGVNSPIEDASVIPPRPDKGTIVFGTVAFDVNGNKARATPVQDIPARLFTTSEASLQLPEAAMVLAPDLRVWPSVSSLGSLNATSDISVQSAYRVGGTQVVPHMSLLARSPGKDLLADVSNDGRLYVDFLALSDVLGSSVSMGQLLSGKPFPSRLKGGEVALLVPDGYTGSRYVETPSGPTPSYTVLASLVNSAMTGKFIHRPVRLVIVLMMFGSVLLYGLALMSLPQRSALAVGSALGVVGVAVSIFCLIKLRLFVPGAQCGLVLGVGVVVGFLQNSYSTLVDRVKLGLEIDTGSKVQRLFMPPQQRGSFGPWEYWIAQRPFGPLSGDWCQTYVVPDCPFAVLAIGDVVGKGTSAALITAAIALLWADVSAEWEAGKLDIEHFLRRLDRSIQRSFKNEQNSTLSLAVLAADRVTLVQCGAPPWIKVASSWDASAIRTRSGNPLGSGLKALPILDVAELEVGDVFLAYSDGVADGIGPRKTLLDRLARRTSAGISASLEQVVDEAFATMSDRRAGQDDDATVLAIRYTGLGLPASGSGRVAAQK